jgi:hypothetical protein
VEKGAQPFETVSTGYVMINSCLPMTVPVPWDSVFQEQYAALIRAFGDFVAKEPHRDLIAAIKLIGLVYLDEISHLPSAMYSSARSDCVNVRVNGKKRVRLPDDISHWRQIGYTHDRILAAFTSTVNTYKAAFPDIPLELSVTPQALPPIDSVGAVVTVGAGNRPNIRSASASSHPLIEIANSILGHNLIVSDHSFLNFKPNANLRAYYDSTDAANIGFVNAWPISNDDQCIMTGGVGANSPGGCTGPWAMAQNLTEAVISGASYMVLDLWDLVRPDYWRVLRQAHNLLVKGGASRLVMRKTQDFANGAWTRSYVAVSAPSPDQIEAPFRQTNGSAPPVGFVAETPDYGVHCVSSQLVTPGAGEYAFSVFAGLPRGVRNARWVKVSIDEGRKALSQGVFMLNGKVQDSWPITVDPTADDRSHVNGGPGAAQSNTFMTDHSWNQLVLRFRTQARGPVNVMIALVVPKRPVGDGGGYVDSFSGDPASGIALWSPQLQQMIPSDQ